MTRNLLRAGALYGALLTSTAIATTAYAQTQPAFRSVDANGVDLTHGDAALTFTDAVIGSGPGALSLTRIGGNRYLPYEWDRMQLRRLANGAGVDVEQAMTTERFTGPDNAMTSTLGNGSTLAVIDSGNQYLLTRADGTQVRFGRPLFAVGASNTYCSGATDPAQQCRLVPLSITAPDGSQLNLSWEVMAVQASGSGGLGFNDPVDHYHRLESVSNSYGYKAVFSYLPASQPTNDWYTKASAELRNENAANPVIGTISYSSPTLTTTDVTDMAGRTWRITGGADILGIRAPGQTSDSISVARGSNEQVTSVTAGGVTTSYSRTVSGSTATTTVTDANNQQSVVVSDLNTGRPTSVKDALNRTTSYQYDGAGRVTRVTAPEGNYVQYSYDPRGNVTETRAVAKPGSGLADIVTSAVFPASCANPVTCNKPTSTTDARGNVTDYTYDASHGGVLTVTGPAPTSGADRPQVRYSYTQLNGEHLVTGISTCASGSAPGCVGTAAESRTVIGYDPNGRISSLQQRDGTGALSAVQTMTHTPKGDLLTVDGPLAGTGDTVRYRYDDARQLVGAIGPDPDGAGPLQHRAVRNIIDARGLVTRVDAGTVASPSDGDWANMAVYQSVGTDYDSHRRPVVQRLTSGGTTYSLAQMSYDALGRPECLAQRMNPAAFGSLPASACSLGAEGTFGPDRITRTSYDTNDQVTLVQSGYGTAAQANEAAATYRLNGQVETLTDGENNRTTFAYDGHDRLQRTTFPVATKGAGQSNGGDYEELGYDPAGNVTSRRVRDGNVIAFSYDALNRPTLKNLPGSEPDVTYGYDLLGQLTSAATASQTLSFSYDALGRQRTESGPLGTVRSTYDAAGRRTMLIYPDRSSVDYSYLTTGEMTGMDVTIGIDGMPERLITFGYDNLGRRTSIAR
ncbi:MAG TPA: hypothetical protein VEZ41_01450, partial [Allosphingosinicella sp.]|nr:hypothetical protein [Allosphingosinicella sp.]